MECQWIDPERNQLEVAARGTEPTGPANQEYDVMPEVASRVVADLGASDLALDAFSSGTSAHLRVCEKYWSAQDSAWKKHWGPHQGLMWIHCPRWDIPRAVAKIRKDRSKAVLVVPMGCTKEESTRHWVVSLTNMTLNKVVLPAGESVYQDANGQPMPPQRWPTEFHYVDGGLDQADATDFVCVNRIIAEPLKKVPTRTGPRCAPSACNPCRFAPAQRLHLSKSRVPNPKIWKILSSFNPEQQPDPTNTAITQSTLRASVQHTGCLTVAGMYKNCTKEESPEIGICTQIKQSWGKR